MVPFTLCTCDQIHGPIYTLYLCLLWGQTHGPIYTFFVSVVGSNLWSDLHPVLVIKSMVRFTPCTCDQILGPIYTLYLCLL